MSDHLRISVGTLPNGDAQLVVQNSGAAGPIPLCTISCAVFDNAEEIARKLAAAPDMYEALILMQKLLAGQRSPVAASLLAIIDIALAKAGGRDEA